MRGSLCACTCLLACLLLLLPAAHFAQVTSGRIQGTVNDAQGGVVPGAEVKVENYLTGQSFETVTNEIGFWALPSMPTARYTVTISLPGFRPVIIENVKVDAGVP